MKKTILFALLIISSLGFSQSRYRNTGLDTASKQVNNGPTIIQTMNIAYPATTIVYVKFYDQKAQPNPAVDKPVITLQVGTDATLSYKLESYSNVKFKNGLWIRCATAISDTAMTGVQPSTKPLIEITY